MLCNRENAKAQLSEKLFRKLMIMHVFTKAIFTDFFFFYFVVISLHISHVNGKWCDENKKRDKKLVEKQQKIEEI